MKLPSLPNFATMSRRERVLAAGSALVVVSVLLDRAVLSPWLRHSANVHREIRQLEEDVRNYQGLLARKGQILEEAEAYADFLRPLSSSADMAGLLREIEAMGRESGMTLGEMKLSEGASSDLYQEYTIDVQYQGSLPQWVRFVYLLQTSNALFTIERSSMARKTEEAGALQGSLRVSGRVIRGLDPSGVMPDAAQPQDQDEGDQVS
jgi:Tfp pilus assembly protein PilO